MRSAARIAATGVNRMRLDGSLPKDRMLSLHHVDRLSQPMTKIGAGKGAESTSDSSTLCWNCGLEERACEEGAAMDVWAKR
jgi:hypothetical protein